MDDLRHPRIARANRSVLIVIDCQERLWKVIAGHDDLENRLVALVKGARLLGVPVLVTEQNPAGLGATILAVREAAGDARVLAKSSFSCMGNSEIQEALRSFDRDTIILAGIEAHICVLQTALDALAEGYDVQVVADACGSRHLRSLDIAFRRIEAAGAVVTAFESVLFEWMDRCDAPAFRQVRDLLK